ncbi:MAG: hypothetical protein ACI30H_02440 [Paludibacteraceae bacterium]
MDYRTAALVYGANYNALIDYRQKRNPNAKTKMNKSATLADDALSHAIRSNFPNLVLEFVERNNETGRAYPVDLKFQSSRFINTERVIFKGELMIALQKYSIGTIEYNFNTQEFYRVSYSDKTGTSRKINRSLSLIIHNTKEIKELLTFLSNYWYAVEDYENMVDTQGHTPSKKH